MSDVVVPRDLRAPHRPAPQARTLWSVTAGVVAAVLSGIVAGLLVLGGAWPLAPVVVIAAVVLAVVYERAAWRRRTWQLDDQALELRRGVVVQRVASIPYHRIQQVDVESGPLDRAIGLCELVVRTAAATTDATIPGLEPDDAALIRARLLELAGADDAV